MLFRSNWTPNEIVQNTSRLDGVAGAIIAMQDGLLVASHLPPSWKPDVTAAFLPQILSRLNQYTKEMHAGELQSVNLNLEGGALMVFSAGIIYFAVLGKSIETLPLAHIRLIVAELSRHAK